jgi:hypothetical protein
MWRFGFCVLALLATPVAAQSIHYTANDHDTRRHVGQRHSRLRAEGLTGRGIDPYRLGPAPTAFLYRCDAPQGFYPYIPVCRMPWRVVPSGSHR